MKKYQIIGGQYEHRYYGESDTLRGARIIATKNIEHWDNWQGLKKPSIYLAEDVIETISYGSITIPDGQKIRVPSIRIRLKSVEMVTITRLKRLFCARILSLHARANAD